MMTLIPSGISTFTLSIETIAAPRSFMALTGLLSLFDLIITANPARVHISKRMKEGAFCFTAGCSAPEEKITAALSGGRIGETIILAPARTDVSWIPPVRRSVKNVFFLLRRRDTRPCKVCPARFYRRLVRSLFSATSSSPEPSFRLPASRARLTSRTLRRSGPES